MQTYSHARTLAHGTLTAKHTKTHAYLRFDKLKMQDTPCKCMKEEKERRQWPNETPLLHEGHNQTLGSFMQSHFLAHLSCKQN